MRFFFTLLFVTTSSFALTTKEKIKLGDWSNYLKSEDSYSETVKKNCGHAIEVKIDENMVTPFLADNSDPSRGCDVPRSAMAELCKTDAYKTAISKIKKIHCKIGKAGEASFSVSGDTLTVNLGLSAPNVEDKAKEYLENNL
jgi:hypothetical protein